MSSKQAIQERRRKRLRQNNIIIWIMGIGVVLVVSAIVYAIISSNQVSIPDLEAYQQSELRGLGDPNAPVVIQEFSDFGCTHCADFALGTKKLLEKEFIDTIHINKDLRLLCDNLASQLKVARDEILRLKETT